MNYCNSLTKRDRNPLFDPQESSWQYEGQILGLLFSLPPLLLKPPFWVEWMSGTWTDQLAPDLGGDLYENKTPRELLSAQEHFQFSLDISL